MILKLMTWNIRWGRGIDDQVDLDRIVKEVFRFADADVLCLQEVTAGYDSDELTGADGSNQFAVLAEKLSGYTAVSGYALDQLGRKGKRQQFGNMIFSRFPLLQIYRHHLPWPVDPGVKSMQRMALEAVIDTPIGPVSVITTHLEFYSSKQRLAQIEYLLQLHRESCLHAKLDDSEKNKEPFVSAAKTTHSILTGDFNFPENSPERDLLLSHIDDQTPSYIDAWEVAHPGKPHAPTMGLYDRERWPEGAFVSDYIFVSSNLQSFIQNVRVDAETQASDHQPVLLEMAFPDLKN